MGVCSRERSVQKLLRRLCRKNKSIMTRMKVITKQVLNDYFQSIEQTTLVISLNVPQSIIRIIVDFFDGYKLCYNYIASILRRINDV